MYRMLSGTYTSAMSRKSMHMETMRCTNPGRVFVPVSCFAFFGTSFV